MITWNFKIVWLFGTLESEMTLAYRKLEGCVATSVNDFKISGSFEVSVIR